MDAFSIALGAPQIQQVLDLVEQFLADDGFVPTWVEVAFVQEPSGVVRVAQYPLPGFMGYWLLDGVLGAGAGGEAPVGHDGFKALGGVVASGVQFERFPDQGSTFCIEFDGFDHAALEEGAGVQIANTGLADGATVDCLVLQLYTYVFTRQLVLHVVEDVGNGFHHLGVDAVAEVFAGRDEFYPQLVEEAFGEGSIDVVAEGARAGVDDDVLDLPVLFQVLDQLLELTALFDGFGRDARVEELLGNAGAEVTCLAVDVNPLRGNGIAVRIDIASSVHLLLTRYS
nr:hypothetical protein [Nocardia mexicana]